jgi:hypothetical protein
MSALGYIVQNHDEIASHKFKGYVQVAQHESLLIGFRIAKSKVGALRDSIPAHP